MYDNTSGWRQARVDLRDFAGYDDIQLRFDFSTAGTMNQGLPGDRYGNFGSAQRAQQNDFEGAYIDDIIIGFAERGEMVTGTTAWIPTSRCHRIPIRLPSNKCWWGPINWRCDAEPNTAPP